MKVHLSGKLSVRKWVQFQHIVHFSQNRDLDIMKKHDPMKYALTVIDKVVHCRECGAETFDKLYGTAYKCTECDLIEEREFEIPSLISEEKNYKKTVHFSTHLNNFLVKKVPDIPQKVFDDTISVLTCSGMNPLNVEPCDIYAALKKLRYKNYYQNYIYIFCRITGKMYPVIAPNDIELMNMMFKEIESAWKDCKLNSRDSLINYLFTIRKILELIGGYEHYIPYFKISDSYKNLRRLDLMWMRLCEFLNYEYIATV